MDRPTATVRGHTLYVQRFAVSVIEGPDRGARVMSQGTELSIGTSEGNDLRLGDPAVSRHHCALRTSEGRGLELVDFASRNGTFLDGVEVVHARVRSGSRIDVGRSTLDVNLFDEELAQPLASIDRFGPILGGSPAMRRLYPVIEQCGRSTANVLVVGETGTGKELIAEAIHAASDRRDGPFVVVDCSTLAHDLAESELFGHERGAFAGAEHDRTGAFEAAHGGTICLDEIGEMPLDLQPLLLRVLENRTIRHVGSNEPRTVDVRVIAASHRDLRAEVNDKRFRADLFFRLNVLRIGVPALRERAGDISMLAGHFWRMFRAEPPPAKLVEHLSAQSWPGNVRELRNAVEQAALLGWKPGTTPRPRDQFTYAQAKEHVLSTWERDWIAELMASCNGNVSKAARVAKMARSQLRRIARRHGVVIPSDLDFTED